MILYTLVVNSVELSNSGGSANEMSVSQESPHLFESHGEGLFALVGFNLPRVFSIPMLKLRVMTK